MFKRTLNKYVDEKYDKLNRPANVLFHRTKMLTDCKYQIQYTHKNAPTIGKILKIKGHDPGHNKAQIS